MNEVDESFFPIRSRLQEDRAGTIAEDDAGSAVLVIDDGRHHVGANDENFFMCAALNELHARLQRINKSGTRGGYVESPRAFAAKLVLHETSCGGEHHVR